MATITSRKRRDGSASYTAQIRIKRGGERYTESGTFSTRKLAEAWARKRESELEQNGIPQQHGGDSTVAKVVEWYERDVYALRKWGSAKTARLKLLRESELGQFSASRLTTGGLLEYMARRRESAAPSTVLQEMTWLRVVLRAARAMLDAPVALDAVQAAIDQGRMLGALAESERRERRPTADELARLLTHFRGTYRGDIPMADIIEFALLSGRRLSEITRLQRDDLDRATATVLVRDLKHPRKKDGNHRWAKLLADALAIIDRQPGSGPLIFPYSSKTISHTWWAACQVIGIEDLHFHDLRHEATCRLFERGYSITEVMLFTLHESWNTLKRYTHLRAQDVPQR